MSDAPLTTPLLNARDVAFQLYEVLDTEALTQRTRFTEHSRETFDAAIDTARKIAENKFAPHNARLDKNEPSFDGEKVHIMEEVKDAYQALAAAGFIAGRNDYEEGGMQLPEVIMSMCMGYFTSANAASSGYPFLTIAAANLLKSFASESLKAQFLPPMLAGRFSGTMALTEPEAGSSLADIRTQASPVEGQDFYYIKGSKMYISGGDHELTDNIVHLVLAKIAGAPAGVKGISLFLVPKFTLDAQGAIGQRNDVALAGLIHKLGYRGTTSTVLAFGEKEACVGYLIGEPHQGLRYMFQMMNEARVGVAMGATMIGYRGYLYSLAYARDRVQGRLPSQGPQSSAVPIIQHGDVKRMLLAQKAYVEGGLSLCLYGASLLDDVHTHPNPEQAQKAQYLLDLLTPVIKSWCSEYGPKANDLAIQILGGAGYTREYPVEQYWRDNRLNPIHEGTNGIQALDLMGRKIWQHNSQGLMLLNQAITEDIKHVETARAQQRAYDVKLKAWAAALTEALKKVHQVTRQLSGDMQTCSPDQVLANATCYMNMLSKVVVAWCWLRQGLAASKGLSVNAEDQLGRDFYLGKLQAAQYFFNWELPMMHHDAQLLLDRDSTCFDMASEGF